MKNYYVVWLSEREEENPNWAFIRTEAYPQAYYYNSSTWGEHSLGFYTETQVVIAELVSILGPSKSSMFGKVGGLLKLISEMLFHP